MTISVNATKNVLANAYAGIAGSNVVYVSVHVNDPGSTGINEASGGSPAYARKPSTWGAVVNGQVTGSQVAIDLPANTYNYAGLWKTATGGQADFIDKVAIAPTTLGAQGQLLITPTFTVS
ncbi:hypothetical protein VMT65_22370 [Nocardia sp. CDC153]|uniref:phage tail fiber protein n=1 Tax=Nocardia sp. CDC153 TaxID=3112167 RepID=UPI002DB5B680|nr:hypothetical protein [Nocardia sp. CDC153]MEC3955795.1 hypothetical protein [Nocardia sp. CDC153]